MTVTAQGFQWSSNNIKLKIWFTSQKIRAWRQALAHCGTPSSLIFRQPLWYSLTRNIRLRLLFNSPVSNIDPLPHTFRNVNFVLSKPSGFHHKRIISLTHEIVTPKMSSGPVRDEIFGRSHLENLPAELLHEIFLLSANLNLACACGRLRFKLIIPCHRILHVIDSFSKTVDAYGTEGFILSTELVAQQQTDLLQHERLTYPFLKICQRIYMSQRASQQYCRWATFFKQTIEERNSALAKLERALEVRCSVGLRAWENRNIVLAENHTGLDHKDSVLFRGTLSRDTFQACIGWSDAEFSIVIQSHDVVIPDVDRPTEPRYPDRRITYQLPACASRCQVPARLLRGHWTQEKGDFLKTLLDAGARVDLCNKNLAAAAVEGLEDAIRQDCVRAVKALTGRSSPHGLYCSWEGYRAYIKEEMADGFHERGGDAFFTKLLDPKGSWTLNTGLPWSRVRSIGVIPTTLHLKTDVIEKGCKVRIVVRLVTAEKHEIDLEDEECACLGQAKA